MEENEGSVVRKGKGETNKKPLKNRGRMVVGATGFEPATSWSRSKVDFSKKPTKAHF